MSFTFVTRSSKSWDRYIRDVAWLAEISPSLETSTDLLCSSSVMVAELSQHRNILSEGISGFHSQSWSSSSHKCIRARLALIKVFYTSINGFRNLVFCNMYMCCEFRQV